MHTKDQLADALLQLGLFDMSMKARDGFYHDFLSPLALPELQLVEDLADAAKARPDKAADIIAMRQRVMDGEFDASAEESEDWANSKEGQDTFRKLIDK